MIKPHSVLVVGGGSAGWMSAAYLAATTNLKVSLVESANVPIIGVGESTIPSINDFMESVGISEDDLFSRCSAIRKYTIEHNNWNGRGEKWYHHFCFDENEHDEQMSWMKDYVRPNKKWRHAYHLDATQLGSLVRDVSALPKGVVHIVDDIVDIVVDDQGVKELVGKQGKYSADLYIDCTGFKSLIRGKLGIDYITHPNLINDYAIAGPGEYVQGQKPLPYTQTFSMDYGWRWRVCIQHRTGNGYAFNSNMISIDQAVGELISKTPGLKENKIFEVKINNRYMPAPWKKNVIAMGLSCGFAEPLEATGLFLVHAPLKMLVKVLGDKQAAEKYNRVWSNLYKHIVDFLGLHYSSSSLNNTDYWRSFNKIQHVNLPQYKQSLFDQYSYRNLAKARGLSYS